MNLKAVWLGSMLLAAVAMAALLSMKTERNLFAEGAAKAGKLVSGHAPLTSQGGPMRSCVINGKKTISNTECSDQNKTSKAIVIHDARGFEAPKQPPQAAPDASSDKLTDKMIEKQLQ
ncbi:MAG: hypothetical protein V4484_06410 [Pseudomonadota bacterium]